MTKQNKTKQKKTPKEAYIENNRDKHDDKNPKQNKNKNRKLTKKITWIKHDR